MKKLLLFVIMVSALIGLTMVLACQPYRYYGKHPELYSVFVCAIPGAGSTYCTIGNLEKVETDSYGRVLFRHRQNITLYQPESVVCGYAVCQHYDGEKAYYLEDVCFDISASYNDFTDQRIEVLKKRNNWEQPLDLTAAGVVSTGIIHSHRYPAMVYEGMITWEQYKKCSVQGEKELPQMLKDYLPEYFEGKKMWVYCYEIFGDGRAFYIVRADDRTCIVATNTDGSIYDGSPLWIDNPFSEEYIEQLVKFRAEFEAASEKNG